MADAQSCTGRDLASSILLPGRATSGAAWEPLMESLPLWQDTYHFEAMFQSHTHHSV